MRENCGLFASSYLGEKKKTAKIEMNKGKDKHCAEHKLNFILKKKKDILEIEKVEKKCEINHDFGSLCPFRTNLARKRVLMNHSLNDCVVNEGLANFPLECCLQ